MGHLSYGSRAHYRLTSKRSVKAGKIGCQCSASEPLRYAKVPHAIALWLLVLRRVVLSFVPRHSRSTGIPQSRLTPPLPSSSLVLRVNHQNSVARPYIGLSFGSPGITGAGKSVQNAAYYSVNGSTAMQRPSISNGTQAFVFSTPATSRTSLTFRSSGTPMLRMAAP